MFTDHASGKDTNRPALQQCLDYIREGDELVVHSMDRLARSLVDLRRIVDELRPRAACGSGSSRRGSASPTTRAIRAVC